MDNLLVFALLFGFGVLLGAVFFGGLWWTVKRSVSSSYTALYIVLSFVLRMGIALFGFYLLVSIQLNEPVWQRILCALLGFISARIVITRITRERASDAQDFQQEDDREP